MKVEQAGSVGLLGKRVTEQPWSIVPADIINNNIFHWGVPEILFIDNSTKFLNKLISNAAKELGIRSSTTPPYHTQANPVEKVNRVLKTMIASFVDCDHQSWDMHLPFRLQYRDSLFNSYVASSLTLR